MINRDHRQRARVLVILDLDGDGRVVEGCVDIVDWKGVVRVGGVTRNVDNHRQLAARLRQQLVVDEGRYRFGEVAGPMSVRRAPNVKPGGAKLT